jgi:hypothetical protein
MRRISLRAQRPSELWPVRSIAELTQYDPARAIVVPPHDIRQLRDLVRRRVQLRF